MEYRRRRRRRRTGTAKTDGTGGTIKAVVVLIVIAAVIYVFSASAAGAWIAEKVFAPMFQAIDGLLSGPAGTPGNTPGGAATPGIADTASLEGITLDPAEGTSAGGDAVTDEVSFPALDCFALQMGVFSDITNAEKQAGELKARGAGGFVMEDAGRYRVLAAAYQSRDDLSAVRAQLQEEGLESAAHELHASGSTLRITASQEQLESIAAGFDALMRLNNDLAQATLAFDKDSQTLANGRERAGELLAQLQADHARFEEILTDNIILQSANKCFESCEDALTALVNDPTQSIVDFSSKMKYTHLSVIQAYDELSRAIAGSA